MKFYNSLHENSRKKVIGCLSRGRAWPQMDRRGLGGDGSVLKLTCKWCLHDCTHLPNSSNYICKWLSFSSAIYDSIKLDKKKSVWRFLKKIKIELLLGTYQKE
jgi:hypothetical protein